MKIMNATRDSKTFLSVDKMNSYLIKIKFDMHLGTIDEKESPNVYGISFDCYCDCNEVPHETGEEFKKVNNPINKEHIHFYIHNSDLRYWAVKAKKQRNASEFIYKDVLITTKIMYICFRSVKDSIIKKRSPNMITVNSLILGIYRSFVIPQMGL